MSHDSSRLLTRVAIPKFSGDKRIYESWKAAFLACVDNTLATPEYKLLRLRNSLEGEALQVIESLGHSAGAYHVAKERLERKYGGKRRQMVLRLEELDKFKQIRDDNAHDLERFSELLDVLTVNLIDVGQHNELGGGALYITLQRKLNENLLSRYNRWVFEKGYPETVESLRTFVNQESEFLTTASETVGGILKDSARKVHAGPTFVTQSETKQKYTNRNCVICNQSHGIWACETFKSMNINQRWDKAKEFKLCFRCLSDTHRGERCPRSRICGINGCKYNHNRLLHEHKSNSPIVIKHETTEITNIAKDNTQDTSNEQDEGESPVHSHTTTLITDSNSANGNDLIALRTVPVHLKCGNRTITVNALMDDASSRSYINSDIAAQLGLEGIPQRLTVQVLNNNQATLDSSTVDFVIESIDGKISRQMSAYTTKRVTGNLKVVNWNKHKGKWSHLKEIHFPQSGPRVIVDILIGVDQSDLHCSLQDIGGGSGEPIARLTPLGWTCIGGPYMNNSICTNLTFFQHDIADSGGLVRRFWEIKELPSKSSILVKPEEKITLPIVSDSLAYNDGHYSVSVPWKSAQPELPNNYKMAVNRLENTEKRLPDPPEDWPENKIDELLTHDKEIRKQYRKPDDSNVTFTIRINTSPENRLDPIRYSSWVRLTRESFSDEIHALKAGRQLQNGSKLLPLKPILDDDGLLGCDGQLQFADCLPWETRFPVILPRKHWVTTLIVKNAHEQCQHGGTNQVLSQISIRYWIISGREVIREWERECMLCRRRKASPASQIMAPLPELRTRLSLCAFSQTSVDFGGPFITKQGRGKTRQKRYLCLFTCLATRAVHLDMAYSLTIDSFLNAFYRMASRRNIPQDVLSDNGTNIVGGDNELRDLVLQLDQDQIQDSTANPGVRWHFNPPGAPHFSGVHEVMIKHTSGCRHH